MQMKMNLKKSFRLLLVFYVSTSLSTLFAQFEPCNMQSSFKPVRNKTLSEDYNIPTLDFIDEYKELIKESKSSRSVVFNFFFDETNKFNKTAEQYLELLKDSLQTLRSDIDVIFKIQNTKGSIFLNDGENKYSVIHLNALIYSNYEGLIKELFGKGKEVRIDTVSTNVKKFTHEFLKIESVHSEELGYLYLFHGKLTGKGFACDPKEDLSIVAILKKIYNKGFIKKCEERLKEEKEAAIINKMDSLTTANETLSKKYNSLKNSISQSPNWMLYSNIDFLTGNVKLQSNFTNSELGFKGNGVSCSTGFLHFKKGTDRSGLFVSSALTFGTSNYSLSRLITHQYTQEHNGYNSIASLTDYNENIKSTSISIPLGLGYQLRDENWPVYIQFSMGLSIGLNKLTSVGGSGLIDYTRTYPELDGVPVENQPEIGLLNNVVINGTPYYDSKSKLLLGFYTNLRVNYAFSETSPLSGFMNFGYAGTKVKTESNGSAFVSTELGEINSSLNSVKSFKNCPLQFGLGIAYELRNKIKEK